MSLFEKMSSPFEVSYWSLLFRYRPLLPPPPPSGCCLSGIALQLRHMFAHLWHIDKHAKDPVDSNVLDKMFAESKYFILKGTTRVALAIRGMPAAV